MHSELAAYVDAWRHTPRNVLELGREVSAEEVSRPTDLPGWTVHDVFAHLAALEAALVGEPDPPGDSLPSPDLRAVPPAYTARGVEARRGLPTSEVVEEFARHVETRSVQLATDPPEDPGGTPPDTPGGLDWDWRTLLRNRAIDVWTHEQDIRRALGRPGNLDGPGARVTVGSFASALPYVLGKRVKPAPGTTVVWDIVGPVAFTAAIRVGGDGRAVALPEAPDRDDAIRRDCDDVGLWWLLGEHPRHQQTGGDPALFADRLRDGREVEQTRQVMVVDTDDGELAGYADAGPAHPVEQPHRDLVRRGDECRRQVRVPQQGGRRSKPAVNAELGRTSQVRVDHHAGVGQCPFVTQLPVRRDGEPEVVLRVATDETDPAVAQVQQVLRRGVAGADVVEQDVVPVLGEHLLRTFHDRGEDHRPSQGTTTPMVPVRPVGRPAALG